MSVVLTHPGGNANVRAVVNGLSDASLLTEFYTALGVFPGDLLDRLSRFTLLSDIRRRRLPASLKPYARFWPWMELGRLLALKANVSGLIQHEKGHFSVDAVHRNFDQYVAAHLNRSVRRGARAVYAYEDSALETFTEARRLGLTCIYDLPIAYWKTSRQLMNAEAGRLPAWAPTLAGGITDSDEKLARKTRELELADLVVAPSQFVADSLRHHTTKRVLVSPFGSPPRAPYAGESERDSRKPLRVLFAGSMSQRKGLGDLFAAVRRLNRSDLDLVVMGSLMAPMAFYRAQLPSFTYEPTRSHEQVLALMRSCDVFCLPSVVEGRALVMQEAMSQGLPLIITPNTGGADLIVEGQTGFLVPIQSPEAIAQKLTWFLDNRAALPAMRTAAQRHADQYTWTAYANRITGAIRDLIAAD